MSHGPYSHVGTKAQLQAAVKAWADLHAEVRAENARLRDALVAMLRLHGSTDRVSEQARAALDTVQS